MRNRPKFNDVQYQVWAKYPDQTEEMVATFKYAKAAEKYITKWTPECQEKNVTLEIKEGRPTVL